MAEAPRGDRGSEPDAAKIISQLKDWSSRIVKITPEIKIWDGFLADIEKTLPKILKDQHGCLKKMLEDGSFSEDVDRCYQLTCNLIYELEKKARDQNVTSTPKIKEGLKKLQEHLLVFHVRKSSIKWLNYWSSCLNTSKSSQNKSVTELENILQSKTKVSERSQEIKELLDWLDQNGWPETMSELVGCIEHEVGLLIKRFTDVLDIIKSSSVVDRLKGMRQTLDEILRYIMKEPECDQDQDQPMGSDTIFSIKPDQEVVHYCPENGRRVVKIPTKSVKSAGNVHIKFVPVKKTAIAFTEIVGLSDATVCIDHDEDFLRPVRVEVPLISTKKVDFTTCALYCVDVGYQNITINTDVKVNLLDENVCSFETISFSRKRVFAFEANVGLEHAKEVLKRYWKDLKNGQKKGSYRILTFTGAGYEEDTWRIHAEVVDYVDVGKTIEARHKDRQLFVLPHSISPSLHVQDIEEIDVSIGEKGPLTLFDKGPYVIKVILDEIDNFTCFLVRRATNYSTASVYFKAIPTKKILHRVYFDPREMNICKYVPKRASGVPSIGRTAFFANEDQVLTTVTPSASMDSLDSLPCDFFKERSMLCLAKQIEPNKMYEVSVFLDINDVERRNIEEDHRGSQLELRTKLLRHWYASVSGSNKRKASLISDALRSAGLIQISECTERAFKENRALSMNDFKN